MEGVVQYLTQIDPPRNFKNIDSLNKVAMFLKNQFDELGLKTSFQEYDVDGNIYKNVIASLNPHYEKRLIVGAHYDVCGETQGADDNASAVAGVVESAKKLTYIKELIPFRIDFVCFSLEEPPYFGTPNMGSYHYASYLNKNKVSVLGMINYEMIGYYTNKHVDISAFEPFIIEKKADTSKGNFIAIVGDEYSRDFMSAFSFKKIDRKIDYIEAILPPSLSPITASDHLSFWKYGYKAIMVTDTAHFRNPNYHTRNDTLETLDIKKMEYVIDMVVSGVKNLIL